LQPVVVGDNGVVTQIQYESRPALVRREARPAPVVGIDDDGPIILNNGQRRILQKLIDIYPMLVTRSQLGTLASYKITGGTFLANWSGLKNAGFVSESDLITVLPDGFTYMGATPREIPATHKEVLAMWHEVLTQKEWDILKVLIHLHPDAADKNTLANTVAMTATGGAFNSYRGNLRRNALIVVNSKDGTIAANGEMLLL
jgi:hypothetical protein